MDSFFDDELFSSIPEPTEIHVKEEQQPNYDFDFSQVFNFLQSNSPQIQTPTTVENTPNYYTENESIQLFIKPARKSADQFLDFVPSSLYCAPYKYDLKFLVPSTIAHTHELSFKLLDGETGVEIQSDKGALQLEKITQSHLKNGQTQVQVRVCFTLCSFHNHKRPFTLALHAKSYVDETAFIAFISQPFHTYARKSKEMDAWGMKLKEKTKLEVEIPKKEIKSSELKKTIDSYEKSPAQAFLDLDSLLLL
jgi:hypothetical protein